MNKVTHINFIITETGKGFSFEWKNRSLPLPNDNIVFNTSINKTDVTNEQLLKILKETVFEIEQRLWVSDNEISIFIKITGTIK